MGAKSKRIGDYWIRGVDDESTLFCFCIYVDTMDDPAVSFRSIDEAGLAGAHTAGVGEYGSDSCCDIVVEEIVPTSDPDMPGPSTLKLLPLVT